VYVFFVISLVITSPGLGGIGRLAGASPAGEAKGSSTGAEGLAVELSVGTGIGLGGSGIRFARLNPSGGHLALLSCKCFEFTRADYG